MHINAVEKSAHPLVHDQAVADAWGQASFASASGVSALLHSASDDSVAALKNALAEVMTPYRQRCLGALSPTCLVVDFDLTGLVISDQATTYEGATFGHLRRGSGALGGGDGAFELNRVVAVGAWPAGQAAGAGQAGQQIR